jgi:hypothetical protein
MIKQGHLLSIALVMAIPTLLPAAADAPISGAPSMPPREVQIHFANQGGIWDWDVLDTTTLLIEDRARRWYKAKLMVTCIDLPFEQKIGFESSPDGSFDKFSAIQTRQQRCPLISLTRTEAPAKKAKKGPAANVEASPIVTVPPHATENTKPLNAPR